VTVVVAYYGGWKTPPEPIVTWHGSNPWGLDPSNNVYMANYPERFPLYGAINEDDQNVIDQHLLDAESAGVGVFAVNWYRDDYQSYPVNRMETSTVANSVKFCIQWSNHYTSMSPTAANKPYLFEGVRRAALRMSNPRYWYKEGKPVLILFSGTHLDDVIRTSLGQTIAYTPTTADRNAIISDIRNIVGNVLSGDLTGGIVGNTVSSSANPGPYLVIMSTSWLSVSGVDASTNYNIRSGTFNGTSRFAHSFSEMKEAAEKSWVSNDTIARANGKKSWPCLMSGWDKRPWGGTVEDLLADNCQPDISQLREHCVRARGFANTPTADNTVFVYAWNEFGEGGWVQPTVGIGHARLDALKLLSE